MSRPAPFSRLLASAVLVLVAAGPTDTAAQTACEPKRRACIAECRAQFFNVDPRRDACIARCVSEANRCAREQSRSEGSHDAAGHAARRAVCPVDAAGPICPGEREGAERVADRPGAPSHDAPHRSISAGG